MEQIDVLLIRLHASLKSAPQYQSLVGRWIRRTAVRDFKIAKEPALHELQEQVCDGVWHVAYVGLSNLIDAMLLLPILTVQG